MNDKSFDEMLARQLQATTSYIDDDGFTAQLLQRLPAHKPLARWLEVAIIWLPVSLISLLVLTQFPWRDMVQPVYAWFLTMDMVSLMSVATVLSLSCLFVPLSLLMKHRFL